MNTDKKIRAAFIGTGAMGLSMAKCCAAFPNISVVAFCDLSEKTLVFAADEFYKAVNEKVTTFASYDQLIKNAVYDAVFIACPPGEQVEIACAEMARGIHVFTQVPAALTFKDCEKLVHAVRKTGVKYCCGEQTRYWRFVRDWRELSQNGEFGKIIYAEGEYLHYSSQWDFFVNKTDGAPVLTDDPSYDSDPDYKRSWRYGIFTHPILYLPHTLSPLLSVTGGRIEKVSCFGTRPSGYTAKGFEVRDLETALMYNENDVVFNVKAGFTTPHPERGGTGAHWYQIKGTECSCEWMRSTIDSPKKYSKSKGWQNMPWTLTDQNAEKTAKDSGHGGADYYPVADFLNAIIHDQTPQMDVYKTLEITAPAIGAAISSENGGELVAIPDYRKL